jgi:hypothetical protein
MKNWLTAPAYIRKLYPDAGAHWAAEPGVPESLRNWLGRLRLLYGVPFNYLVPDSRLLPVESIRFFYVDRNFTDRLVDGALSVGKTTTREFLHHTAVHSEVRRRADEEERVLRRQLRGEGNGIVTEPGAADLTGLLLRSRAVSGWPGLEVKAFRGTTRDTPTGGGSRLPLLRMDRLAPDVLLCLFHGVPTRVDVEEPREGIQFGVDPLDQNGDGVVEPSTEVPSGFELSLRKLRGADAGQEFGQPKVPVPVRRSNRRVVHVEELRARLAARLAASGEPDADPGPALTSGELALELFQFPFRQRFEGEGDPPGAGGAPWSAGSQYLDVPLRVHAIVQPLTEVELQRLFTVVER